MGLLTVEIFEILKLHKESRIENASLCMMGKQNILIRNWNAFMEMVYSLGFSYDKEICKKLQETFPVLDAYSFFEMFGFKDVHAVDYSTYEGADIQFDLNGDNLPPDLTEKFDFVIDGGTLEHVFDPANAIKNMSGMVKQNGYIYHALPLAGYIDHGFYSFSPAFFLEYYDINHFRVQKINFLVRTNGKAVFSQDCRLFEDSARMNEYISYFLGGGDCIITMYSSKVGKRYC